MKVNWSKPIEAVHEDGRVVALTFVEFDGDNEPIAKPNPDHPEDEDDNSCWEMDGKGWREFHKGWQVRNVQPQGRTFKFDRRDNVGLHELYVNTALDILEAVEISLESLDYFSNYNALQFSTELRKTRAKLVKEDAAFFEAAALSYAGKDWIDAVE